MGIGHIGHVRDRVLTTRDHKAPSPTLVPASLGLVFPTPTISQTSMTIVEPLDIRKPAQFSTSKSSDGISTPRPWSIRHATFDDAGAIASLMAKVWMVNEAWSVAASEVNKFMEDDFSTRSVTRSMQGKHTLTLVAMTSSKSSAKDEEDGRGQIIGVAQSILHCPEPRVTSFDSMKLWRLYVDFDHHGSGAAQALFDETVALAQREKAGGIWLTTWTKSHRAIRFYEKNGFEKIGKERFKVGDVYQEDWMMERTLDS